MDVTKLSIGNVKQIRDIFEKLRYSDVPLNKLDHLAELLAKLLINKYELIPADHSLRVCKNNKCKRFTYVWLCCLDHELTFCSLKGLENKHEED